MLNRYILVHLLSITNAFVKEFGTVNKVIITNTDCSYKQMCNEEVMIKNES